MEVGSCHPNPPCGEAVGRGTAPVGRGGGAAPSRHCPSVSASRCHLPIASRQGGASRPQSVVCCPSLFPFVSSEAVTPIGLTQPRRATRLEKRRGGKRGGRTG